MIGDLMQRCKNSLRRCFQKTPPARKQVNHPKLVLPQIPAKLLPQLTPLPVVFTQEDVARAEQRYLEFMQQNPEYNDYRLEPPNFLDDEDALNYYREVHYQRIREAMALDDDYRKQCEPILAQLESQELEY